MIETFLAMGGFAAYVWSAFGITAAVLFWLLFTTLYQYKKIIYKKRINITQLKPTKKNLYAPNS